MEFLVIRLCVFSHPRAQMSSIDPELQPMRNQFADLDCFVEPIPCVFAVILRTVWNSALLKDECMISDRWLQSRKTASRAPMKSAFEYLSLSAGSSCMIRRFSCELENLLVIMIASRLLPSFNDMLLRNASDSSVHQSVISQFTFLPKIS